MIMDTIAVRTIEKSQGGFRVMAQVIDNESGEEHIVTLRETNQRHFSEQSCDSISDKIEARGHIDSAYWSFR